MDITHDNVCSSMLSCFYSHLLSTGRSISSCMLYFYVSYGIDFCILYVLIENTLYFHVFTG